MRKVLGFLRGVVSVVLTMINTLFWLIPLFPVAMVKFLVPVAPVRKVCDVLLNAICTTWANINKLNLDLMRTTTWEIEVPPDLSRQEWVLVLANHQSWADIVVLQYVLNGRIPYFRFFLKKQLKWFPVLNLAWYALDYPFMERYSKAFLERNPHLRGKDLEITRKSCERFRHLPVAIMNFVEGTRFTPGKREKQGSPYRYLLRPKAGGTAFVLGAMGEQLNRILDVTIAYPGGVSPGLWSFLCGEVPRVRIRVEPMPVSPDILGDYFNDEAFQRRFQGWINDLWARKDETLAEMMGDIGASA